MIGREDPPPLDELEVLRRHVRVDQARMWYRWGVAIGGLLARLRGKTPAASDPPPVEVPPAGSGSASA